MKLSEGLEGRDWESVGVLEPEILSCRKSEVDMASTSGMNGEGW